MEDLPTPPFPLIMAITDLMWLYFSAVPDFPWGAGFCVTVSWGVDIEPFHLLFAGHPRAAFGTGKVQASLAWIVRQYKSAFWTDALSGWSGPGFCAATQTSSASTACVAVT